MTGPPGAVIPANEKKGEKKLMRTCAACGKFVVGGIVMGGTRICRTCDVKVREEIDRLHAEGKPVNVASIAQRMLRENSVPAYPLRNIPKELWDAAKHRVIEENLDSLRELILKVLQEYLEK